MVALTRSQIVGVYGRRAGNYESIARHFQVHAVTELYAGAAYVAVGEKVGPG